MAKVSVIIPAAGAGKRFAAANNKILQHIGGKPIFIRTLSMFNSRDDVCQVQLVVSPADMDDIKSRFGANLGLMGVDITLGGPARTQSVRNALDKLVDGAELVCIHDAVRPCVSPLWIDAVFAAAEQTGAAILAYPLHGTLKKVGEGDVIEQTLPRQGLWEAQTPQVFRRDLIVAAYQSGCEATDDAALVEATGQPVSVVMGDPRNIKITTPNDLKLAKAIIDSLPKAKPRRSSHPFGEAQW